MKSLQTIVYLSSSSRISFLFYGLVIICLTSATISASNGGNKTDHLALLSFKSKITHDPYKVLNSWNHSFHFCEWSGISCGKRHKRVTALQLSSKGLEGSLSPHVGNLSFLRELYLPNNSFQGTIPHDLGRLSRLRRLYLGANKFSGVIPANLSGCLNLELLSLGGNTLAGSIPNEMSLLSKLDFLVIENNNLTGGIPPFLGNITSMEVFAAANNPFGGSIPDTLGLWKNLKEFYSGGCNLHGSIPHSIFNLSLLVNFSLPDNYLTGSLPSEFGNQLPNLEDLQLRDNELTGVLPPSISNCSKLRFLEISSNNFSGKLTIDFSKLKDIQFIYLYANNFHGRGEADDLRFIDSIKNCTRLDRLVLANCNFIGVLPITIGNLSDQLTSLYLGDNQLFGSLPSSIGSLVGLTILNLRSNRLKGKIPTTIGKLKKLQVLNLYSNQFSGPIPEAIGNLSLLTKLYLDYNKLEGHIPSSLGNCKQLNGLNLAHNTLTGKIPKQLLQLPSLTNFLDLSYNTLSGSIPSEIKDLKMLSYLDLSYNNLSGTITSSLGECISLTVLYLRGNIFHGTLPFSLSSLRGLEVLDISQNNLSGKIPQFFEKRFSLEFLNLSFNDFEGEVQVVGVFANASAFSVLGNNKLCGGLVILELPKCKGKGRKKKSQSSQSSGNERFLKVSYNELLKATDGFSTENLIGEGGFSSVYKGILDCDDDKFVAVKVLHLQNRGAHKSFLAECEAWRNIRHHAIDDEIGSIMKNNTWVLSDLPFGCKPLGCKWIFKRKMKVDGNNEDKFKASLLLALAAIHNLVIHQMDVKIAFLNGDLDEEVYMKQPEEFVMPCTRPDIAYAVGRLSRFTSNPSRQHWKAITRVFKYLRGTKDYGLSYVGYPSVLEGYSDASWINHVEDSSSTSGWVFLLGGGAISWASKKQTCITSSTMESEFVALGCADRKQRARNFQVYNGRSSSRWLDIVVAKGSTQGMDVISIEFVRTQHNLADHLTKGLVGTCFFPEVQDLKGTYVEMKFSRFRRLNLAFIGGYPTFLGEYFINERFIAIGSRWAREHFQTLGSLGKSCNHSWLVLFWDIGNQLPNLEFLQLWGNELTGVLPPSISNCTKLGRVDMGTITSSLGNEPFLKVSYNELLKATDGFSTANLIGEGAFSSVYKGILNYDDGRFVAVKVLHLQNRGAHKSFLAECEAWRNIRHPRLLGADLNQNSSTGVKGTIGYAPPVLVRGSEMTSLSLHKFVYMALPDHVIDVIDNDAIGFQSTEANAKKVEECLIATIKIGVSCSLDSPSQRMKIEIVVNELQRILDVLQNI
ncbi:leucine-rich repeat protein [Tanacetum coccineum]